MPELRQASSATRASTWARTGSWASSSERRSSDASRERRSANSHDARSMMASARRDVRISRSMVSSSTSDRPPRARQRQIGRASGRQRLAERLVHAVGDAVLPADARALHRLEEIAPHHHHRRHRRLVEQRARRLEHRAGHRRQRRDHVIGIQPSGLLGEMAGRCAGVHVMVESGLAYSTPRHPHSGRWDRGPCLRRGPNPRV